MKRWGGHRAKLRDDLWDKLVLPDSVRAVAVRAPKDLNPAGNERLQRSGAGTAPTFRELDGRTGLRGDLGKVLDPLQRDIFLRDADFVRNAEEVRDHAARVRLKCSPRCDQRSMNGAEGGLSALHHHAANHRWRDAVISERDLVVRDVDALDSPEVDWEVQVAVGVQNLGFDSGDQFDFCAPLGFFDRCDKTGEPVRIAANVVDAAQPDEPLRFRSFDVLFKRAFPVRESAVNVHVFVHAAGALQGSCRAEAALKSVDQCPAAVHRVFQSGVPIRRTKVEHPVYRRGTKLGFVLRNRGGTRCEYLAGQRRWS